MRVVLPAPAPLHHPSEHGVLQEPETLQLPAFWVVGDPAGFALNFSSITAVTAQQSLHSIVVQQQR